jgi:hypothetical protein
MKADLDVIGTFRKEINARGEKVSAIRKALEKPPAGRVA